MTLQEYYDELARHDWFYDYSDDGAVWRRGSQNHARLLVTAKESEEHKALYDGFRNHHFSGKPWGTEKPPMPERPA